MTGETNRFHGYVEVVGSDKVTGWCISVDAPQGAVELEMLVRGQVIARGRTVLDRPDVAKELGSHRLCGFEFLRSPAVPGFGPGEMLVRPAGSDTPLAFLDPGWASGTRKVPAPPAVPPPAAAAAPPPADARPAPLPHVPDLDEIISEAAEAMLLQPFPVEEAPGPTPSAAVQAAPLEGHFDLVLGGEARGWARRAGAPSLRVELRVDGRPAGQGRANQARPDLAEAGLPSCAFAMPLPDSVFDGQPHEIAVVEADTGQPLPGDPKSVQLAGGGGFLRLRRGVLEGRVWFGDRLTIRLEVLVDGAPHPDLPVRSLHRQADAAGWFTIPLPPTLHDDRPHRLAVRDAGTGEFLQAGLARPEVTHRGAIRGGLDRFSGGALQGWAQDMRNPAAQVTVSLYDAGRKIAEAVTALPRPDSGEDRPRFTLPVPRTLFDNTSHRLRVEAEGLDLCLGNSREIVGVLAAEELEAAGGRFRGRLELVSAELVSGWALDALAPDRPAQVAIELDGIVVATVRADRYEPRFRSLSAHGQHGFAWKVPAECWTGRERSLVARIVGTAEPLAGSPAVLHLPYRLLPPSAERPAPALPVAVRPADRAPPGLVSAIVLNRNGAGLLEALFASMARHVTTPLEVVLIDHGSSDDSLVVAARWQDRLAIKVEARGGNHSYSASNNLGASQASGQYLLFLNNDIELTQDPLPAMLRALAAEGIAAVGARLAEPVVQADGSTRPVLHHDGIGFRLLHGGAHARSLWLPYEIEADEADISEATGAVPAATAAMLLMRREDFLGIGGFDEGYDYGLEDVDLCLRVGRRLGRLAVARDAVAIHQRSATRGRRFAAALADPAQAEARGREIANRQHFLRRQAAWLKRRIREAALNGEDGWRATRFRIGFAVTSVEPTTSAGDVFTATELAEALAEGEGWDTALLPWKEADVRGLDALVAMRPDTAIRKLVNATPGLLTIAWVRNRVDEWIAGGQLDAYDLIFASSRKAVEALREATGLEAALLPIATNPRRFAPPPAGAEPEADILFTGNHWGHRREAQAVLDPAALNARFVIFGRGWDKVQDAERHWRGQLPYWEMPAAYGAAKLVLDDSDPVTRDWNSLNSRVFDAAACGTLVLTNCAGGAEELLAGVLPSFGTPEELHDLARHYLTDEAARAEAAAKLRQAVLAEHTYAHRARTVAAAVRSASRRLRFGIKVPVPRHAEREQWGDWHFAQALARALRGLGHAARLDILPEWQDGIGAGDDVSLVLRGLSAYEPDPRCLNLMWLISHPDQVTVEEMRGFDHVFVASPGHAETLRPALGDKVSPLLQCTDPELFHPDPERPADLTPVVFIGNSRGRMRRVVADALAAGLDLGVWGSGWEGLLPEGCWKGEYIDNRLLRRYYSNAEVVLNDHWDDMREHGFLSNRLFDALACGARVVSDRVAGLEAVFGNHVSVYATAADLPDAVAAARRQARATVSARTGPMPGQHDFRQRASTIAAVAERLLAAFDFAS